MKIIIVIVICLALSLGIAYFYFKHHFQNLRDRHNLEQTVKSRLGKFYKPNRFSGIAVDVYKDGQAASWIINPTSTTEKEPNKQPINTESVFQIGSITKVFTALLYTMLVEEKVISADATLQELIGNDSNLTERAGAITLAQLASHTSGLPRIPASLMQLLENRAGAENVMLDPYTHVSGAEIFGYLESATDIKPPGKAEYSNYGMGLLAHLLERITGDSYADLLKNLILEPLQMNDTTAALPPSMTTRLVDGYTAKGIPTPHWNFKALAGAGALNSSLDDMLKFIAANLEREMTMGSALEKLRNTYSSSGHPIGWQAPTFVDKFFGNGSIVWHNGMTGGYYSYLSINDNANAGVVILSSQAVDLAMLGMMITVQARTQSWIKSE